MDTVPATVARPFSLPDAAARATRESPLVHRSPYAVRAVSRPATDFTADFYLTAWRGEDLWVALGDFAGHGLKSAIQMAMVQEELERILSSCDGMRPAEVIAELNDSMRGVMPSNRFATLVVGYARPDGAIDIVNAGHSAPLIVRRSGAVEMIDSHGPVVGLIPVAGWREEVVRLDRHDRLVLYTDGIEEATSREDHEFGVSRLVDAVMRADPLHPLDSVMQSVDGFTSGARHDDQSLLILTKL